MNLYINIIPIIYELQLKTLSNKTKEDLKRRVISSYLRLMPLWYKEVGAASNGVPVDDFISYASEAMIRASRKFDWTKPNEYGAYARMAIRNATINYGKEQVKRKAISLDKLGNIFVKDTDVVNSLILKLYSPLTSNITTNSTFWITKLMSNPLIETVILTQQNDINRPPIKELNFNIDVNFVQGSST